MANTQDSAEGKLTPMMQQYVEVRRSLPPNTLLLFRLGDFYEMFGEEARKGSEILGITLTHRSGQEMAGIPYHAATGYIQKALSAGVKVAIVEQMETPRPGKMVRRELTRILTPGTVLEDHQLDARHGSYILALDFTRSQRSSEPALAAAWLDLGTGDFCISMESRPTDLLSVVAALAPQEVIIPSSAFERWKKEQDIAPLLRRFSSVLDSNNCNKIPDYHFDQRDGSHCVCKALGVAGLDGFGIDRWHQGLGPAGAILHYVEENLRSLPENLRSIRAYSSGQTMLLDPATLKSLEIMRGGNGTREGSLLSVLDGTVTPPGARLVEQYLATPTLDIREIKRRQSCVGELLEAPGLSTELHESLRGVRDLPRVLGRLQNRLRKPRELGAVRDTLAQIPFITALLKNFDGWYMEQYRERVNDIPELRELLSKALADELPNDLGEAGYIREGFDEKLDRLRNIGRDTRQWITEFEAAEQERTGIKKLRVRFNNAFGYYIEITKANLHLVPEDYTRKQTTVNAERFTTPDLKEKEREVLHAEERTLLREQELFAELVTKTLTHADELQKTADALAELDVYLGWAANARQWDYCKPELDEGHVLDISEGRHPVVEQMLHRDARVTTMGGGFVPNDTLLDCEQEQIAVITGPNMAGKSTYIRQVALIVIMAQLGSYAPARSCRVGLVDRVFSRVGASDELARGNSTFMVEMNETANILNNATERSLVILDEIGRGTSTYDGLSIAWAVVEDLHGAIEIPDPSGQGHRFALRGPRTLFATHYHELTQIAKQLSRVRNFRVSVKEWNDEIIFVRQVIPGAADRSYGIQVARLAGLPQCVVERAREVLEKLEADDSSHNVLRRRFRKLKEAEERGEDAQLEMF
ncbi:MAG: DNA mismatch repair protein MutS [Opitutales bacterium]|nr:DNA mismatch repair protein MutS [Opitutales bacterium]